MLFPKMKWSKNRRSIDDKSKLIKSLDKIFSVFIRLRDADKQGICRCVTCKRPIPWQECDAGHFIARNKLGTRYNEHNVAAQCRKCNRFLSGMQFEFALGIDRRWGGGTAMQMRNLSMMKTKIPPAWYTWQIEEYKKKVKGMKKNYGN